MNAKKGVITRKAEIPLQSIRVASKHASTVTQVKYRTQRRYTQDEDRAKNVAPLSHPISLVQYGKVVFSFG